jgi:hypothetical protein
MAKSTAQSKHAGTTNRRKKDRKTGSVRSTKSSQGWSDRPAGFHIDGEKVATLREVRAPDVPTLSLSELKREQRVQLVLASLRAKPDDFTIGMIGPGVINKTRAIAEVEAQSRIGRTLMEIELMLLSTLTRGVEQVT